MHSVVALNAWVRRCGALLLLLLIVGAVMSAALAPSAATAAAPDAAAPPPTGAIAPLLATGALHCKVGFYVTALHDTNLVNNSFEADVWVWSVCPNKILAPLSTMEFTNANTVTESLSQTTDEANGAVYSSMKVTGQFREPFDLTAYPFDRQHLSITVEDANSTTDQLIYTPDRPNTGCLADLELDNWDVDSCSLSADADRYTTTFGDPTLPSGSQSYYSRLTLGITLSRSHPWAEYFKATAILYAAILMAMISFFLISEHHSLMSPRVSTVGLALFAAALSMESESTQLSAMNHFTMVDAIGVDALFCIIIAGFVAVGGQKILDRGVAFSKVRSLSHVSAYVTLAIFLVINVALVLAFHN